MTALQQLFPHHVVLPADIVGLLLSLPDRYTYAQRLLAWLAYLTVSAFFLYSQRHRPFGRSRLVPALPLVVANFVLPLMFHPDRDLCTNIVATLITMWMTSFKIVGWVLNRGPLVRPLNAIQFVAVYAFPITPTIIRQEEEARKSEAAKAEAAAPAAQNANVAAANCGAQATGSAGAAGAPGASKEDDSQAKQKWRQGGRLTESVGTHWDSARNFLAKVAAAGVVVFCLVAFPNAPEIFKSFLYGYGLYCFLGMLMDGPATLATSAIGMSIAPHFDNPYTSQTFAEFWNKRWNLTAGNLLRFLIYDPINEGRLIHDPKVAVARSAWRRTLGMTASFLVSGVMHELMFLNFAHQFSGHMMLYFLAQPPLIVLDTLARSKLKRRGISFPRWINIVLTMGTEIWLSDVFFFGGPIRDIGVPKKFAEHLADTGVALAGLGRSAAGVGAAALVSLEKGWAQVDVAAPEL